jgi:hypothetical protein
MRPRQWTPVPEASAIAVSIAPFARWLGFVLQNLHFMSVF